jgi:hypothetical protein
MFRRLAVVSLLTVLGLPAPALARLVRFRVSLQGTYAASATMTDSQCWSADADGNVTRFTQTGTASEKDTFRSLDPITLTVSQLARQRTVAAGSLATLRTAFALNRTSTTNPLYCIPNEAVDPPTPDCGAKQGTYAIRVYGRVDRPAFSFLFSHGYTTYYPDDPFAACPLFGAVWPGQLETSGPGPVKPSQLFNPAVHKIIVRGRNVGTTHGGPESSGTSSGTFDLEWTLTLTRLR